MASSYVVTDRTQSTSKAIAVDDGILSITDTADAASSEPIIEDNTDAGTYWKVFVDDDVIGVESTLTVQDDAVSLTDSVTGTIYTLVIDGGVLGIESTDAVTSRFRVSKSYFILHTTKNDNIVAAII